MPNDVLSAALQRLTAGRDLAEHEARDALLEIMGGRAAGAQAILVGEALIGTPRGHLAAAIAALRGDDPTDGGER